MKVRTTMRPDEDVEVNSQERLDLQRWGLLVEKSWSSGDSQPGAPTSSATEGK